MYCTYSTLLYILYILQALTVPKPVRRKTSLAEVIPDWPELKPFTKKRQVYMLAKPNHPTIDRVGLNQPTNQCGC